MQFETNTSTGPITVLLVDTPSRIPTAVENAILAYGKCSVVRAVTVREAMQHIAAEHPRLIVTEWAIPGYSLVELLQGISNYPEWRKIPVLVATVNPTREIIRQSLDLGAAAVHSKPLDLRVLLSFLDGIFGVVRSDTTIVEPEKADIRNRLKGIQRLTPLPAYLKAILRMVDNPRASARHLADIIQRDQSLTARVLKVVNSAFYGFERQIGNINRAIVILGFNEIKDIAMASVKQAYPHVDNEWFDWDQFWLHSLGVAHTARALGMRVSEVLPDDAFVVGLLHDFGKVVFDLYFQEVFTAALRSAAKDGSSLARAEFEVARIDHAEVGGLVAEYWRLPVPLVKAIRYHHNPAIAGRGNKVIHLVHLANVLCHTFKVGNSGNPLPDEPWEESIKYLGLEGKTLAEIWAGLKIDQERLKLV